MLRGPRRLWQGSGGFTLIEVMLCMILFAAAAMIFATTLPMAAKTADLNGQYAQAIAICQHKIDELRQIGYGRLTYAEMILPDPVTGYGLIDSAKTTSPYTFTGVDLLATRYPKLPGAKGTIAVSQVTPFTGALAREVTVTVSWTPVTYKSRTCTVSLVSRIMQSE